MSEAGGYQKGLSGFSMRNSSPTQPSLACLLLKEFSALGPPHSTLKGIPASVPSPTGIAFSLCFNYLEMTHLPSSGITHHPSFTWLLLPGPWPSITRLSAVPGVDSS